MEQPIQNSCPTDVEDRTPDLKDINDNGEANYEEPILGASSVPSEDEIQAIEEMESTLEYGKIVEDEIMAYVLYNKYARAKGFSVRKGQNVWFNDGSGELQAKFFLCNREGTKDNKRSQEKVHDYKKTENRCKCMARLKIARKKGAPWMVTIFVKEHNHTLFAADQTYLLRSSRNLTDEQELIITSLVNSGIPISKAIKFLESVSDGKENMGCLPKDIYDRLRANRKTKIENGDSLDLVHHFRGLANREPDYYWDMEVDDDNRLMNFFIRDYRCLIDYMHFNDVVSFDTTYRTNQYDMVCAPFIGINHHGENIMFGCAFMSDETEQSFWWLFKTFLDSMGGKQPGMIFTDQCKAMMNAVEAIFPESCHKLCQWHINQNAPSHFGSLNNDSRFKYLWSKCMNFCESEEKFEATWKKMEDEYKINEQKWFNNMYGLRKKWSTAFSIRIFSAGLLTTSRSEGTNSALLKKEIKNKTCTLMDCVLAYERVQENWRRKEKEKDILCQHNKPTPFVSHNPLLMQAADTYTFDVYKLFEKELLDTMSLKIIERVATSDSSLILFKVKIYGESLHFKVVEYDDQNSEARCSCHKFETEGILCSHILKVFDAISLQYIPECYIKKRWTKLAKNEVYGVKKGSEAGRSGDGGEKSHVHEMAFVSHATKEVRDLALLGKTHVQTRDILTKHIENAKNEMSLWFENQKMSSVSPQEEVESGINLQEDDIVRDPLVAKTRGITNIHRRFWDIISKKRKGKGKAKESEKRDVTSKKGNEKGKGTETETSIKRTNGKKRKVEETLCRTDMVEILMDAGYSKAEALKATLDTSDICDLTVHDNNELNETLSQMLYKTKKKATSSMKSVPVLVTSSDTHAGGTKDVEGEHRTSTFGRKIFNKKF